ncbi:hypothetical protein D9M70_402790 [compost metagenome]
MRFDPPQVLAQVHKQHRDGTGLRLLRKHDRLLNNQPVKPRKALGIEILVRIEPLQPTFIDQSSQIVCGQPAHLRRAKGYLR